MNKKYWLRVLVGYFILYMIGCLIAATFNPFFWMTNVRWMMGLFTMIYSIVVFVNEP